MKIFLLQRLLGLAYLLDGICIFFCNSRAKFSIKAAFIMGKVRRNSSQVTEDPIPYRKNSSDCSLCRGYCPTPEACGRAEKMVKGKLYNKET